MPTPEAAELSELIRRNVAGFKEACEGIDEETASRAPSGRWSPKEIVSHLCGPEGTGLLPVFSVFVEKDLPRLDIDVEDPFFSEKRAHMTFDELLAEFDEEYGQISKFVEGLSEEELRRTAHIPFLKETPIGEYPTLAVWIRQIAEGHVGSHIDHMKAILKELGVGPELFTRRTDFEALGVPPSPM
jgi:hypothetical protein